jgi:hypothetical protein
VLKRLYTWLAAGCDAQTLRSLGWFEFMRLGAPNTTDARALGAAAIFHLLVDDSGTQLHHDDSVVYAVLGFVEAERGGSPPSRVCDGLLAELHASPVTLQRIEAWFLSTYP